MAQELQLDTAGTLTYDVPTGRPSVATCSLYDPGGTLLESPTVTIDAATTTLTAGASAGATTLALTSATGFTAGRKYLIANGKNEAEWVYVKQVSSLTLTLHSALAYTYIATDTIVGTRLSVAVAAASSDSLGEGYEARWAFTVASIAKKAIAQYDVCRQPWPAEGEIVTTARFQGYAGGLADDELAGRDGAGLDFSAELLKADQAVRRDLLARGKRPSLFRDADDFAVVIMERVLLDWARLGVHIPSAEQQDPQGWRDLREARYTSEMVDALNSARSFDADESGVVSATEREAKIGVLTLSR